MLKKGRLLASAALSFLVAGCIFEECENGYRIKYKTIFWSEKWHDSLKDTLLDGAIRINTWILKDGRGLELRCFRLSFGGKPHYDLRYSINVPLLARVADEINKKDKPRLIVNIDGKTLEALEARAVKHDFGVSFLAYITPEIVDKFANAKELILVMPRQASKNLDKVIEFGVANLNKHIEPVKKECASIGPMPKTPKPPETERSTVAGANKA